VLLVLACARVPCGRSKICLKPFGVGQTFQRMVGYCTKDDGLPHYQVRMMGVTDAEIAAGKEEWVTMKLDFLQDKILINKSNLFSRAYTWHANNEPEVMDATLAGTISRMINKNRHMLAPTLLMNHSGQMREDAAECYFKIAVTNMECTPDMVKMILYTPAYGAAAQRYYHVPRRAPVRAPLQDFEPLVEEDALPAPAPAHAPAARAGPSRERVVDDDSDDDSDVEVDRRTGYEKIQETLAVMRASRARAAAPFARSASDDEDAAAEAAAADADAPTAEDNHFIDDRPEEDMTDEEWR
jgi:hypothetical protein